MKRKVTKRELNQQTAQVLADVTAGKPLVVTERGVAKWRIESVEANADPLERMIAEGRIVPAKKKPAPWATSPGARSARKARTPADVDALLHEIRGDR